MGTSSSRMYYSDETVGPTNTAASSTNEQINNIALSTNIVLIPYSIILSTKTYQHQQPRYCRGCGAALNKYSVLHSHSSYMQKAAAEPLNDVEIAEEESKREDINFLKGRVIQDLKENESTWICEFCDVHNRLPSDTVLPQGERELYLIKKGQAVDINNNTEEAKEGIVSEDRTSLIFCIDVSGSMSCKHEVEIDGNIENVPRMQLLQNALLEQLKEMKESHPHRKVGVVLFGNKVTLEGDGNEKPFVLTTRLDNFERILAEAEAEGKNLVTKSLGDNYLTLEKVIKQLEIGGKTALGPGLLSALALAKEGGPGSRVILCTDGLANVGIGNLEHAAYAQQSRQFYERVGDFAVEKRVSVSIITVKGQACKVDALGPLTDRTAGQIIRVDPANFDLANLAANDLIATDVKLRAIMHEGLSFKNEHTSNLKNNNSILVKNIGSVSVCNEAYFEYSVKTKDELRQAEITLENLESLPLQAQISYTDLQGNEFVFIISQRQFLTKDQKEAEKGLKADILAGYVQKQSANLVLDGKVEEAKKQNEVWSQQMAMMAKNADLDSENKAALALFKEQNEQLQMLINNQNTTNAAEKDDITSKLYEIKQQKQSKF